MDDPDDLPPTSERVVTKPSGETMILRTEGLRRADGRTAIVSSTWCDGPGQSDAPVAWL